jgi:hypothetical protein
MPIEPFDHLGRGLAELASATSDRAASRDDGAATILVVVAVVALYLLVKLVTTMARPLPPGKLAPWTGWYQARVAPETKVSKKGNTLPPTTTPGSKWRLKEPHSSSLWLLMVLVLAVVGALCYGQVDLSQLSASAPPTPENGSTRAPAPHPGISHGHRAVSPHRHLTGAGHHRLHHVIPQHP